MSTTKNVPIEGELHQKLVAAAEKFGFRIKALVEQGIKMRLDALAKGGK